MLHDPLVGAVLNPEEIWQMTDDMLVHQAVEQLRLWSGRSADPVQLRRAAEEALRKGPEAPPPARGDERNRRT